MTAAPLRKILLVDDDRVTNLMHRRFIERAGLAQEVDIVTDGVEALEYLRETVGKEGGVPELILLDINMPRMNGFEFLEDYAHLPSTLKEQQIIVLLSTSALPIDIQRARDNPDVHRYFTKPAKTEDIAGFIKDFHEARMSR